MTTKKTRQRRKVYPDERRKWLDDYQSGTSMNKLALSSGRNPQTVKRHIEIAKEEREYSSAQVDAYRRAIIQHNDQLLGILKSLRGSISIPHDEGLTVLGPFGESISSALSIGTLTHDRGVFRVEPVGLDEDDIRLLELTREHLNRDKDLWSGLARWQTELKAYAEACYALGQQVAGELSEHIDLQFLAYGTRLRSTDEGIHEGYVFWACRLAIERASGRGSGIDESKLRPTDTELKYGGTDLATCTSQAVIEELKALFVGFSSRLSDDILVRRIVRLRRHLEEEQKSLRRTIGDFLLLGLVRGRCSVCKRLRP